MSSTDRLAPKNFIFICSFCFLATECSFLIESYEQNSASTPPRRTVSRVKNFYPLQIKNIALEKYFLLLLPLLRFIKIQNKLIRLLPPSSPFLPTSPSHPSPVAPPSWECRGLRRAWPLSPLSAALCPPSCRLAALTARLSHAYVPPPFPPPQHLGCN